MKKHTSSLLFAAVAVLFAGCSTTTTTHGQLVLPSRVAQVQPGTSTKNDVLRLLGSPSTTSTLDTNRWYYISTKVEDKILNPNLLQKRDILIIDFSGDIVSNVSHKNETASRTITPAAQTTPTHGQKLGVIDQILSNVGLDTSASN